MCVSRNVELCFTSCQSLYLRQRKMSSQVSSRGTRNRSTEMLIYVISTSPFKLQGSTSRNSFHWLLAASSFLFYVLWKTIKPLAVALSPAVNCRNSCSVETECTLYLPCENVWCETFLGTERVPSYHLCVYMVFSFMPSDCMWSPKVGCQCLSHAVCLQSAAAQLGCFLAA